MKRIGSHQPGLPARYRATDPTSVMTRNSPAMAMSSIISPDIFPPDRNRGTLTLREQPIHFITRHMHCLFKGVRGSSSTAAPLRRYFFDILPRLKSGDSYCAHPGIEPG